MRRALLIVLLLVLGPQTASARDLFESEDGEYRLSLRSALKGSWLLSFPPDDPLLVESVGGGAFFRLRFEANASLSRYFTAQVAYEHRALASSSPLAGAGLLPSNTLAPYRLTPLDWALADDPSYGHRHELDRGFVSVHLDFLELTVGRQAVGLGRGVLFSAIDLFAPFTPNEVDREWRRGIDAVHAEVRIPQLSGLSGDVIVAFGDVESGELAEWAAIGRIRAIVGDVDGEVILGRRGEDDVVGGALSATIGDAEVHAELALFGTDGRGVDGGFLGTRGVVAKGLIGGSYMFDIHRGLRVVLEYHYSGFGIENVGASPDILFDPAFQARLLRGDSQILGRHAIALALSAELFDDFSAAVSYLQSPVDGSGSVAPSFTWNYSESVTFLFNVLVPWGAPSEAGVPQSEWGASPTTLFLQARFYD
jgi:hypothetical protein